MSDIKHVRLIDIRQVNHDMRLIEYVKAELSCSEIVLNSELNQCKSSMSLHVLMSRNARFHGVETLRENSLLRISDRA